MRKINDFLKYGEFADFKIGMTYEELTTNIGEEKLGRRWMLPVEETTICYSYFCKDMEFRVENDKLTTLNLQIDGKSDFIYGKNMANESLSNLTRV